MMEEIQITTFKNNMENEKTRILHLVKQWRNKNMDNNDLTEEVCGHILSAVGKANLLVEQRFNQFAKLIEDCELKRGEMITTIQDLHGFWDMILWQIDDVMKNFQDLDEIEKNNWQIVEKENKLPKTTPAKMNRLKKPRPHLPLTTKNTYHAK